MKRLLCIVLPTLLLVLPACRQHQAESDAHVLQSIVSNEQSSTLQQGIQTTDTNRVKHMMMNANSINRQFPDSAVTLYKDILAISNELSYDPGVAAALLNIGDYYYGKSSYAQARNFYAQAVPYCRISSTHNKNFLPGAHSAIGNTYYQEGNYDSAQYFYFRALDMILESETVDTGMLLRTHLSIGAAMEYLDEDYHRAIQYTKQAEQLAILKKDTVWWILSIQNLGTLYSRINNLDSSLYTYRYALALAKQTGIPQTAQELYNYVGSGYLRKGDLIQAKAYLDSAINIDKKLAKSNAALLQNLGYVHYSSGEFRQAIPFYEKALQLNILKGEKGHSKLNSYATLARLYDTIGLWQLATKSLKAYIELSDSLVNKDKINAINQLEIKFRTADKDRLLATKDLEIVKAQAASQQKTAVVWIASLCSLLLISLLVFFRYGQLSKLRRLQQQKELDLLKATMEGEEAERLRVGQELHDGVSGLLSAIKMNLVTLRLNREDIAEERNFITTMALADEAADELRKTAHNLIPSSLMKNGLYQAIQGFCKRIGQASLQLDVRETGIPRRLEPAQELIIYRTVQELVHNMIKHAGASKGQVALSWQEQVLLVTVEDNGTGINPGHLHEGIGLDNIRKGIQKSSGTIEIDSISGEGTSVYLEYPLS